MHKLRTGLRVGASSAGALIAMLPALAAAEEAKRALDTPADSDAALLMLGLGFLGVFVAASIGFLYRQQRELRWDYQLSDGALSEGEGHAADADTH
jgi:hypothetical protein